MKKKTILVLASTFPRWENDAEPRFVYDLCLRLQAHFNIIALVPHTCGASNEEVMEGLRVIRYRYAPAKFEGVAYDGGIASNLKLNKFNYLVLPFFLLAQAFAIWKILKREPVDIIHAHWLLPQGALALLAIVFSKKNPTLLCTSHGGDLFGLRDPLSTFLKRWVIRRSDALTVVSSAMQEAILELVSESAGKVQVIPMGSDLKDCFVSMPSVRRKTHQLLFVGRLVPKKGVIHLIEVLPRLVENNPDVRLCIAGGGPEKRVIEKRITELGLNKNVVFLGVLSHAKLAKMYRESTVAVFPFVQAEDGDMEGLGLVMVEALGCACPVIAGNVPAVKDVIDNDKTGLIVDPRDPVSFAAAIERIFRGRQWAEEIALKGNEFVLQNFDWDSIADRYREVLVPR